MFSAHRAPHDLTTSLSREAVAAAAFRLQELERHIKQAEIYLVANKTCRGRGENVASVGLIL